MADVVERLPAATEVSHKNKALLPGNAARRARGREIPTKGGETYRHLPLHARRRIREDKARHRKSEGLPVNIPHGKRRTPRKQRLGKGSQNNQGQAKGQRMFPYRTQRRQLCTSAFYYGHRSQKRPVQIPCHAGTRHDLNHTLGTSPHLHVFPLPACSLAYGGV